MNNLLTKLYIPIYLYTDCTDDNALKGIKTIDDCTRRYQTTLYSYKIQQKKEENPIYLLSDMDINYRCEDFVHFGF